MNEISEHNLRAITPAKSRATRMMERFINWYSEHCKLLVDALDEGERIHQIVERRKEEERLKAIRSVIPYRFF